MWHVLNVWVKHLLLAVVFSGMNGYHDYCHYIDLCHNFHDDHNYSVCHNDDGDHHQDRLFSLCSVFLQWLMMFDSDLGQVSLPPDVDFPTVTVQVRHAVVWSKSLTVARETARLNNSLKKMWDQPVTLWPQVNLPILNRLSCFIPQGSKAGQPLKPPCRPGFTQNFYTVIVSRDILHGQSILKGKSAAAGSHLLTDDIFSSLPRCVPNLIVWLSE